MSHSLRRRILLDCRGQAATEFTIIAAFVLVPLFLLIPLLGKYIDIKSASIQQARFEAWEYTAWFDSSNDVMDGVRSDQRSGIRDFGDIRARGNRIFFGDITAADYGPSDNDRQMQLNPLWIDHHGDTLFSKTTADTGQDGMSECIPAEAVPGLVGNGRYADCNSPDPTSGLIGGGLIDDLLTMVNWVTHLFGRLLHLLGVDADFDALRTKGYFVSTFRVDVRSPGEVVPDISHPSADRSPLDISARASVMARGWNAGSTQHASSESRGLVVTSLLSPVSTYFNKAVNLLQRLANAASHILPFHITLPHGPIFGHIDDDLIPYEHLQGDKRKTMVNEGLYYYAEE
jgi:hypothetical protein